MNKRVGRLEFKAALEDSVRSQKGAIILLEVLELIHGNYSLLLLTILSNCSAHVHNCELAFINNGSFDLKSPLLPK